MHVSGWGVWVWVWGRGGEGRCLCACEYVGDVWVGGACVHVSMWGVGMGACVHMCVGV